MWDQFDMLCPKYVTVKTTHKKTITVQKQRAKIRIYSDDDSGPELGTYFDGYFVFALHSWFVSRIESHI